MKIKLEQGQIHLDITLPDDKVLDIIMGKDVPALGHDKIKQIISKGIKAHTPADIIHQKIAIIIPDNTRLWARGDVFVPQIVRTLFELGVARENIKIIIALGTHEDMEKDQFAELAGNYCTQRVNILNSANKDQDRLVHLGKTYKNTHLTFTREAVEADHIIIFGGILHHMIAGFGGGRKYILPGIAGYDTIQENHSLAIRKDGSPHPLARQAKLWGNPINEDLNEAADLFLENKTCTYVAIAANGTGDIFHAGVGPLHTTFMNGCKELDRACCIHVPEKGDFALISAGGYRVDGQLYQATKALFNAVNIVKEGGSLLFVAGCSQGAGNETFSSVLKTFKEDPQKIGKELAIRFNMPAYVAFRVIDVLNRFDVTLFSAFSKSQTTALGFGYTDTIDDYIKQLKGKGYIIPFAENILPVISRP
ncbi:nickel-dependent lactate racemase [Desulfobacula sp.]|uniref:nickel-dependent lactate racemase n=1 Tax=Desulfobacula sp. TaxID=2593537 RepID=UPI00263A33F8|nr:nickel-dependent lactate racemase [Desulfobacula sp.]